MQDLIQHLISPLLNHPAEMQLTVTEGKSSVFIEMNVHEEDVQVVLGENNERLDAINHILSIASGTKKPSLELLNLSNKSEEDSTAEAPESDEGSE